MKQKRIIYFSVLIIIILLILTSCFSYAFFMNKKEEHGKLNIVAGTLNYKIESNDLKNYEITVEKNTISKMTLTLISLNDINSKYLIYYTLDKNVEGVEINYLDTKDMSSGTIDKNGKKEILIRIKNTSDDKVTVKFGVEGGLINNELVLTNGNKIDKYINTCEYQKGYEFVFNYSGSEQDFVIPCDGNYKIELWGAQGGSMDGNNGGKGAYTKGIIYLESLTNLYVFIGGAGSSSALSGTGSTVITSGGYNGGGKSASQYSCCSGRYWGSGGGATDIRLIDGEWNNFNSLKSRIMVAAGGGGAYRDSEEYGTDFYNNILGGDGGALEGFSPLNSNGYGPGSGGTQTSGGKIYDWRYETNITDNATGGFGYGGFNEIRSSSSSGGGGGYYGGGGSVHIDASGGGSSFISGYTGCDAISMDSTEDNIIHTGQPIHYSGYKFTETKMIAGNSNMPTHDGTSTMIGNSGNGYAKITYLGF